MHWNNGCGCGGASEHNAAVSRGISAYIWGNIPTKEIEHNIVWLDMQRRTIENHISALEKIKTDRARSQKWRDDMNALAEQFQSDEGLDLDIKDRIEIIRQRLGCTYDRATFLAGIVHSWAKTRRRTLRDENICYEYRNGVSAQKLAQKHKVSRQQIHNIVRADKKAGLFA